MFEGSVSSGGGNNQAQFQTTSHSQGRNDNYIVQSSTKGRGLRDGSPTGAKGYIHQQTPFFQLENTDHKNHQYSGYSVKEFSLGKPQKFRSTYKKNQLFQKTEDQANPSSKDSVIPNKENLQPKLINSLNELKRIRNEFVKVIEQEISEKNKHNQVEYAALNDDITLLLNDDTRINNSFINESHQKPGTLTASISPLSNTPSKSPTPSRFIPELGGSRGMPPRGGERSKSNQFVGMLPQHLHSSQPANTLTRKEDGLYMMTNSQLMTSLDRAEATGFAPLTGQQRGYNTTPDRHSASPKGFNGNDSFLNKSQDFPKMLKRKASRPYTKLLIPFMIDKDRDSEYIDPVLAGLPTSPSRSNPSQEWRIFDLFKVQRFVKKEFSNEYYEGLCLIRGQKRPVLIRRTTDQSAVMREIMMNLVFYENEVNFSAVSILKMRDFFNTNGHFHVIYDRPGDWLLHSEVIASGLSEQVCMSMAADLAKTIGLIHSLGIVHSKLCPESLYLGYDSGNTSSAGNPNGGMGYRLRVSDFEHAFFEGEHTDKIVPSNYSAPEVIFAAPGSQRTQDESHALGINFNGSPISGFGDDSFIRGTTSQGRIQVDRRSDYWSVGCLLYFLGTGGSHLFPAKSRLRTGYLIEKLLSSGSNMMGVPSPGFTQTKPSFPEEMVYLYPGYADKLSKLTSEVRTELDAVAAETSFKLEELRNSKPALFRVISDCLKLNPEER